MWSFIQDEIFGMKWLNHLIGNLLSFCELDVDEKLGAGCKLCYHMYENILI